MALLRWGNDSGVEFSGFLRATVDSAIPFPNGFTGNGSFFLGNQCGLDTWCIDLFCGASPNGDRRSLNTNSATPFSWEIGPSPLSTMTVRMAAEAMTFMGETTNGAAWDGHWRLHHGPLLLVELFVHWYPDNQQFAYFELIIVNSQPNNPNVVAFIPANWVLTFDTAVVLAAGLADNAPVMPESDHIADGQCRILSGVLCWPSRGGNLVMCRQLAEGKITFVGIDKLHHHGNPLMPPGFQIQAWNAGFLPESLAHQHNWPQFVFVPGVGFRWSGGIVFQLDPNVQSGDTASQGSQKMIGGPVLLDCGASAPFYFAGLAQKWPCNHCEADGRQLDPPPAHPNLAMSFGRVNRAIGPPWTDNLGKPFEPSENDRHGLQGPEWEHDFDWTLWVAKRIKGTRALEWLVSARARLALFSEPSMRLGFFPPARGRGWWLFKCVEMYRNLTDRALANQVKQMVVDVLDFIYLPVFGFPQTFPENWWSWTDSAAIGASPNDLRALAYQIPVEILGLKWAGDVFNHQGARDHALNMANSALTRIWIHTGTRWQSCQIIRMNGQPIPGQPDGAFDFFMNPFVVSAMLLINPSHGTANAIWTQLVAEAGADTLLNGWNATAWLGSPGVLAGSPPTILGTASVSVEASVFGTNALTISAELRSPGGLVSTSMSSASILTIAGTASGSVDTSVVATGLGQAHTNGVANVSVGTTSTSTAGLLIAAVFSDSVGTSVVSAGANVIGLSGLASVSVGTSMSSAGVLTIAGVSSGTVGTSVASTGTGTSAPSPISGVVSRTVEIGVTAAATIKSVEEPVPRRRFKRWHWWDIPLLTSRRRRHDG